MTVKLMYFGLAIVGFALVAGFIEAKDLHHWKHKEAPFFLYGILLCGVGLLVVALLYK